jgi:regulator of RNase E activity RraA
MLSPETEANLRATSTATLTSQLMRRGFRNTFIRGLIASRPDLRMVGRALTLRYVPAREDLDVRVEFDNMTNVQRLAVEAIEAGQVLVIDARGDVGAATFGHILATRIMRRGAAGMVTDGAVRDSPRFPELDLPVYYRAPHATASSAVHHPADMNVAIGCGGLMVMPEDVVVGDAEGVVVIPAALADEVARDAAAQEALEDAIQRRVDGGASIRGLYPPDDATRRDLEARLRAGGC